MSGRSGDRRSRHASSTPDLVRNPIVNRSDPGNSLLSPPAVSGMTSMARSKSRGTAIAENPASEPARSQGASRSASGARLPVWKKLAFGGVATLGALVFIEAVLWACGVKPAYFTRDPYAGFTPHVTHFQIEKENSGSRGRHPRPEQARVAQRAAVPAAQAAGHLPDRLPGRLGNLRPALLRSHLVFRLAPRPAAGGRPVQEMGSHQRRGDELRQLPDQGADDGAGPL